MNHCHWPTLAGTLITILEMFAIATMLVVATRVAAASYADPGRAGNCTLSAAGTGIGHGRLSIKSVSSAESCCTACDGEPRCVAFTFEPSQGQLQGSLGKCYLKDNVGA